MGSISAWPCLCVANRNETGPAHNFLKSLGKQASAPSPSRPSASRLRSFSEARCQKRINREQEASREQRVLLRVSNSEAGCKQNAHFRGPGRRRRGNFTSKLQTGLSGLVDGDSGALDRRLGTQPLCLAFEHAGKLLDVASLSSRKWYANAWVMGGKLRVNHYRSKFYETNRARISILRLVGGITVGLPVWMRNPVSNGCANYLVLRSKWFLLGIGRRSSVSEIVWHVPQYSRAYRGSRGFSRQWGFRRFQRSSMRQCIPGLWKEKRISFWLIDLADFWGLLGSETGNVVSSSGKPAASAPGSRQFVMSNEGGEIQVLDGTREGSALQRDKEPKPDSEEVTDRPLDTERRDEIEEGKVRDTTETIVGEEKEDVAGSPDTISIAEAAMAATFAVEASTKDLVEATEAAFGAYWKRENGPQSSQSERDIPEEDNRDRMERTKTGLDDERFRRRVAMVGDADSALSMIAERSGRGEGVVSNEECLDLISAALAENNSDLAYSILNAMRSSLVQRRVDREERTGGSEAAWGWQWAQYDVSTYAALVRGLAASLRVADAIETVADVRRRGIPAGDEVPFGKVVSCPTCKTALAVVQPQQGVQVVPCAKCRYQYELMSGTVVNSESESISMNISAFERGLRVLQLLQRPVPAAVHSIVVRAPDGLARTHRCATESADIPAQEGERVTVASAAPADAGCGIGPLKVSARTPGWRPSEPMAITNHVTGRVSSLCRAPPKLGTGAAFDTSIIVPTAFLLASSDAATALIDPTLPRLIAVGLASAVAIGGVTNTFVLPRLNQLPQRTVNATALRQQLLAQHESVQARLEDLTQAAAADVRMLARMCQLQNKMEAVGEPAYSARIERVLKAREGVDERLAARLELIDSYAKIASMIEIEVEMDVDVLAAEAAGAAAGIAEQIEQLMEVDDLQKAWQIQAEASDEVERLLRSAPLLPESA